MQKFPSDCHNYFRTDAEVGKGLLLRGLKMVHGAGEMAQVKSTFGGPGFSVQNPHCSSQWSVTPVPGIYQHFLIASGDTRQAHSIQPVMQSKHLNIHTYNNIVYNIICLYNNIAYIICMYI